MRYGKLCGGDQSTRPGKVDNLNSLGDTLRQFSRRNELALIYNEKLIDLGPLGLLALTIGDTAYVPIPAQLHGYARWHDETGAVHDRFDVCMRQVPRAALSEAAELQRVKVGSAVPSVQGRVAWFATQICDEFRVAPTAAASIGDALVLLVFAGVVGPAMFRIVDVAANRVVYEETAAALCARLNMNPPPYAREAIESPLLVAGGSGHVFLNLAYSYILLTFTDGSLRAHPTISTKEASGAVFSRNFFFSDHFNSSTYQMASLASAGPSYCYQPKYKSKAHQSMAAAAGRDLFAVGHQGGRVELLDGEGVFITALRPYPRAPGNEQLELSLSYSGNFLGAAGWSGSHVVDIGASTVAAFDYPDRGIDFDRTQFVAEVLYRPDFTITDNGLYTLSHTVLVHTRFSELAWSPVLMPGRQTVNKHPAYEKVLSSLRKPSLALQPGRGRAPGNSFMYGEPALPADTPWPDHEGQPMMLLCQIDLADAAELSPQSLLPQQGRLLFFVSVDGEGEILEDDELNPAATRVLWLPRAAAAVGGATGPGLPAKPIRLAKDPSELPQPDAAVVQAQLFSDDELEEYRSYLETQLPDGLSDGNRLGGYPHNLQSNNLEALAEHAITGDYPADDLNGWTTAARWHMLLQLESDEFMWGTDSGILYFMIHDDDLRRQDFSRVVRLCAGL